jgi:TatD DNase family protein
VNHESNQQVLAFAKKYDIVKAALGLYPLDATNLKVPEEYFGQEPLLPRTRTDVDTTLDFIAKNKANIIALGEVGMDLKFTSDLLTQAENFKKIIDLSLKIKKPLIVHSRKAEKETVEMLESAGHKQVIMHCFGGSHKIVKRIEDAGWMLTIPANVSRSSHFQEIVKKVHISRILTETDAPYLSASPGKRNEPSEVIDSVKVIARIKGMTEVDTANAIFQNYQNMFL